MIKNIFFDLAGVICNMHTRDSFRKFHEYGMPVPQSILDDSKPINGAASDDEVLNIIHRMDTGELSGEEFIDYVQCKCHGDVTREQLISAFNDMVEVPKENLELLEKLHKHYKLFLVSNVGDMHWETVCRLAEKQGYKMENLFNHCFCSYQMEVAKPDKLFFDRAITESGVIPEETIYLDDAEVNIKAGKKAKLQVRLLIPNSSLYNLEIR